MTKKDLLEKLNKIYMDLDNYPRDTNLKTAFNDINKIKDELEEIISEIETTDLEG